MTAEHATPELSEEGLLAECPRCRYLLRGLPIEHACPECDLTFDRRWRVFGGKPMLRTSWRVLIILGIILMSISLVFILYSAVLHRQLYKTLPSLAVLAAIAWLYRRVPLGFVAVGPGGIALYRGRGQPEVYTWDRIGKADYDLLRKPAFLTLDGISMRLRDFTFFRGDVFEAESCVRCINGFSRGEATCDRR